MQPNQTRTLLVIAGEFPPLKTIGRIRTVKFVKHLQDLGWKAIVVTLEPSGQEPNYDQGLLAEIAEGVAPAVRRAGDPAGHNLSNAPTMADCTRATAVRHKRHGDSRGSIGERTGGCAAPVY